MKSNKKAEKKRGLLSYLPQGKKAIGNAVVISLILTLLSFGLLAITISKAIAEGDDLALETACRQSINIRASTVLWAKSTFLEKEAQLNLVPPLCTTIDKRLEGSKEEVIEEIADLSARCWWMFAEGRYDEILSGNEDKIGQMMGMTKGENDCFICYSLLMDEDDFEGETSIPGNEIMDFMFENEYGKVGEGVTYFDYIQEFGGPGRFYSLATSENGSGINSAIEARNAYAIVFAAKNSKLPQDDDVFLGIGAAKIAVGLGGALVLGLATGGVGWVTVGALGVATLVTASGYSNVKAVLYDGDRDVSSIYLDNLREAQAHCHEGDLGGN
ncbi:hypothetical protein HOA92_04335 [archaeon]|nr:hypothetical protein [archaeon]MBT6762243.1 hypothetical protein [archaeon]